MANKYDCSNVTTEMIVFSQKLHKLSSELEKILSSDKYKSQPKSNELHVFLTELDDRITDLVSSCPSTEELDTYGAERTTAAKRHLSDSKNELFEDDF